MRGYGCADAAAGAGDDGDFAVEAAGDVGGGDAVYVWHFGDGGDD